MDLGLADAAAVMVGGSRGMGLATAPVAAFLASRRNSYMTGASISVDGGSDFT